MNIFKAFFLLFALIQFANASDVRCTMSGKIDGEIIEIEDSEIELFCMNEFGIQSCGSSINLSDELALTIYLFTYDPEKGLTGHIIIQNKKTRLMNFGYVEGSKGSLQYSEGDSELQVECN